MYKATVMLSQNGGAVDNSNPTESRHRPPPSVIGDYHKTAQSMGDIMNRHAHSAVQGALLAARQEVANGQAPSKLDNI